MSILTKPYQIMSSMGAEGRKGSKETLSAITKTGAKSISTTFGEAGPLTQKYVSGVVSPIGINTKEYMWNSTIKDLSYIDKKHWAKTIFSKMYAIPMLGPRTLRAGAKSVWEGGKAGVMGLPRYAYDITGSLARGAGGVLVAGAQGINGMFKTGANMIVVGLNTLSPVSPKS